MKIKILGPGCVNCRTLERRTHEALEALQSAATVVEVYDLQTIAGYGIMRTPGLVIDEEVVSSGSVPNVEELKSILLLHGASVRA